ncbi:hypothetical protein EXIGLDRAFT_732405, partial [Exidia glandulosa HHB12029]
QGSVLALHNHYHSLRLPPQNYIVYNVTRGQGDSYIATVQLLNYTPAAYYVGTGIGQMGAKEAAAYYAGRALRLW